MSCSPRPTSSVSGFKIKPYGPRACFSPRLLPRLYPRFSVLAMSCTQGNSARTISAVPSLEAESTTMVSRPLSAGGRLARQARSRSRTFHETMMIEMSGGGTGITSPAAASGQRSNFPADEVLGQVREGATIRIGRHRGHGRLGPCDVSLGLVDRQPDSARIAHCLDHPVHPLAVTRAAVEQGSHITIVGVPVEIDQHGQREQS